MKRLNFIKSVTTLTSVALVVISLHLPRLSFGGTQAPGIDPTQSLACTDVRLEPQSTHLIRVCLDLKNPADLSPNLATDFDAATRPLTYEELFSRALRSTHSILPSLNELGMALWLKTTAATLFESAPWVDTLIFTQRKLPRLDPHQTRLISWSHDTGYPGHTGVLNTALVISETELARPLSQPRSVIFQAIASALSHHKLGIPSAPSDELLNCIARQLTPGSPPIDWIIKQDQDSLLRNQMQTLRYIPHGDEGVFAECVASAHQEVAAPFVPHEDDFETYFKNVDAQVKACASRQPELTTRYDQAKSLTLEVVNALRTQGIWLDINSNWGTEANWKTKNHNSQNEPSTETPNEPDEEQEDTHYIDALANSDATLHKVQVAIESVPAFHREMQKTQILCADLERNPQADELCSIPSFYALTSITAEIELSNSDGQEGAWALLDPSDTLTNDDCEALKEFVDDWTHDMHFSEQVNEELPY